MAFASNVLFGLGLGCYATPSTDTAVANAPENKIGVASGIYKMGSSLGGAMGIAVTASLFALFLPLGMAHAAQYALWFNAVLCLGDGGERAAAAARLRTADAFSAARGAGDRLIPAAPPPGF